MEHNLNALPAQFAMEVEEMGLYGDVIVLNRRGDADVDCGGMTLSRDTDFGGIHPVRGNGRVPRANIQRGEAKLRANTPPRKDFAHHRVLAPQKGLDFAEVALEKPLSDKGAADPFPIDNERRHLSHRVTKAFGIRLEDLIVSLAIPAKTAVVTHHEMLGAALVVNDRCDKGFRGHIGHSSIKGEEEDRLNTGCIEQFHFFEVCRKQIRGMIRREELARVGPHGQDGGRAIDAFGRACQLAEDALVPSVHAIEAAHGQDDARERVTKRQNVVYYHHVEDTTPRTAPRAGKTARCGLFHEHPLWMDPEPRGT